MQGVSYSAQWKIPAAIQCTTQATVADGIDLNVNDPEYGHSQIASNGAFFTLVDTSIYYWRVTCLSCISPTYQYTVKPLDQIKSSWVSTASTNSVTGATTMSTAHNVAVRFNILSGIPSANYTANTLGGVNVSASNAN